MSADLALAADPSVVEQAAGPGAYIIQACERAKSWLREALDHGDIDSIVECKSQAEAIRVYTMSKQLGKDAQLSATEIVRRAERGIGVALRKGQADGTIKAQGDGRRPINNQGFEKRPVTDFAAYEDLTGNGAGIYHLTDDVSDEDFEEAIATAREEGNLSRANVTRKVQRQRAPDRGRPRLPILDEVVSALPDVSYRLSGFLGAVMRRPIPVPAVDATTAEAEAPAASAGPSERRGR